jgi:hypothetical protein
MSILYKNLDIRSDNNREMRCEIQTEYELEMCLDGEICLPMEIPISHAFMLKDIEVNASDSPLSHLCSIKVLFGKEMVYDGPIGQHGFVMQITELEPRGDYALRFTADCSALHTLVGEPIEPVKVVITGYEVLDENTDFADDFNLEWS